jgi:enterochelin esterase family protein
VDFLKRIANMPDMIGRWPIVAAVLMRCPLISLCLMLGWSADAQDAAPADRNAINTRARPGDMMADSPVTFPKEGALPARYPPDVRAQDEPAEKDYYIFSSPCRSLVQIAEIQAAMPKGQFTPPAPDWPHLRRTRQLLTQGGELRLLALGDSIVNDTMRSGWVAKLAEAYPKAKIQATVYVRGGGGCQHYRELNRIATYVIPRRPNLVFIGGISQRDTDSIREVIHQLRAGLPEVEILLATGAFGTVDPRDPEALAKAPHSGTGAYGQALGKLAAEEGCAYLDMTTPWAEYIRSAQVHPHLFYRDVVHANEYGEQILSKILMAFWTAAEPASSNVRGGEYPKIHPDQRITFRVKAPNAKSVAVAGRAEDSGMSGNKPYEMARDENGIWTVTTDPVRPGFHYYELIIDGWHGTDPASETYFGWGQPTSGLEVPDPALDFYDARNVPHGEVRTCWYRSKVTGALRRLFVYTPPGYDREPQRRYPVLYLQHGAGESERAWTAQGRANFILDNLIAVGKAKPMLIVMENGYAAKAGSGPVPGTRGNDAFAQLVVQDLVPFVDSNFQTVADRDHRAIAGLSMGAGQALQIGLSNLDLFAYIAGLSGGVRTFDPKASFGGVFSDANAAWWGFDRSDSTEPLQAAVRSGAATLIIPYMGQPWVVRPIQLASDQEILLEPGVLILAKRGEFQGAGDSLFSALGQSNIVIRGYGACLRMHKRDYQRPPHKAAEWRMGIALRGCRRVLIEGLRVEGSGGDGFYVDGGGGRGWSEDITLRNCAAHDNHRQGVSVISAVNLLIENCAFSNTWGTAPEAGIDLEPDTERQRLVNCVIRNSLFENNNGNQILVHLSPLTSNSEPVSIRFENCLARMTEARLTPPEPGPTNGLNGAAGISVGTINDARLYDKSSTSARVRFVNCSFRNPWISAQAEDDTLRVPILFELRRTERTMSPGGVDFLSCYVHDAVARPALGFEEGKRGLPLRDVHGQILVTGPGTPSAKFASRAQSVDLTITRAAQ